MFESILVVLLNKYLAPYVDGFDQKQLNIGVWTGDIILENLQAINSVINYLTTSFIMALLTIFYYGSCHYPSTLTTITRLPPLVYYH